MAAESSWLVKLNDGILLRIQVQPRASRTEIVGLHGEPPRLKIRLAAPPVDGEANEELLRFLKKALGVPSQNLEIVRGHTSKMKDVVCQGVSEDVLRELLGTAAAAPVESVRLGLGELWPVYAPNASLKVVPKLPAGLAPV